MSRVSNSRRKTARQPWSFRLVTVAGIPIRLHLTFFLLLLFFAWVENLQGGDPLHIVLLLLALFGCVLLHELGHSLAARLFGIKTRDITLYPIGGVASLTSMGKGHQEFWITAAGPAVNVVIAIGLYVILQASGAWVPFIEWTSQANAHPEQNFIFQLPFLQQLCFYNVVLAVFNLIPAFPMDGGRLLRSLLSGIVGQGRATRFASLVGRGFAILFGIFGLLGGNFILVLVAIFIFFAAGQENVQTQTNVLLSGHRVHEAMIREFVVLHHADTLGDATDLLLRISQQDFPVVDAGGKVIGVLTRKGLISGISNEGRNAYVAGSMTRDFEVMRPEEDLEGVMPKLFGNRGAPVLVFDQDRLIGMITSEHLMEYLMVRRAASVRHPA